MSTAPWNLTVGRQHPAAHGPIAMSIATAQDSGTERIVSAEPVIYPMHRGAEKLFESRDYQQLLSLADRHDWTSSFGSELGLALTVEEMSGMTVPPRATWIRMMMAELNRAIHHLHWLGESPVEVLRDADEATRGDARDIQLRTRSARENLTLLHEAASGGRLHPMLVTYGGVKADLPTNCSALVDEAVTGISDVVSELSNWWAEQKQLQGVGVLPTDVAIAYATSGPVARGSGSALDLRFTEPYLAYDDLLAASVLTAHTAYGCDVYSRFNLLVAELATSLDCVRYASEQLATSSLEGPVNVRLPRKVRVPEGSGYGWTENPTGINGWYLVSSGGPTPERLKLRTASFANAQALCQVLVDSDVDDLATTMLSFMLISGDLAK